MKSGRYITARSPSRMYTPTNKINSKNDNDRMDAVPEQNKDSIGLAEMKEVSSARSNKNDHYFLQSTSRSILSSARSHSKQMSQRSSMVSSDSTSRSRKTYHTSTSKSLSTCRSSLPDGMLCEMQTYIFRKISFSYSYQYMIRLV